MSYQNEIAALRNVDQKRVSSLLDKLDLSDEEVLKVIQAITDVCERDEQWDWMRAAPAAGDKFIRWCQMVLNIKPVRAVEFIAILRAFAMLLL
jgi:hypothetical protein